MHFLVILSVFLVTQCGLIILANINVWPEVFFLSYLINKGYLPFRDYFDDHGFFMQVVLAPFIVDKSLFTLKIIYALISFLNLYLFLLIIRKNSSNIVLFLSGVAYILTAFFLNENDFWFETLILTFLLLIYYLIFFKKSLNPIFIGILISVVSFIKISAGIILLPILILTKKIKIAFVFFVIWTGILIYYYLNHGLESLITNLFSYNYFLSRFYRPQYLSEQKLLMFGLVLVFSAIYFIWKDNQLKKIAPVFLFWLFSFTFLASGYSKVRLLPLAIFSLIIIFQCIKTLKWGGEKMILVLAVIFYCGIMIFKVRNHIVFLNQKRVPYIENKIAFKITDTLKRKGYNNFYILSNNIQPYFFLNKVPPIYYPLKYPLISKFDLTYENKIITQLANKQIEAIVVPKPIENEYHEMDKLVNFIKDNYQLKVNAQYFFIYEIK